MLAGIVVCVELSATVLHVGTCVLLQGVCVLSILRVTCVRHAPQQLGARLASPACFTLCCLSYWLLLSTLISLVFQVPVGGNPY